MTDYERYVLDCELKGKQICPVCGEHMYGVMMPYKHGLECDQCGYLYDY